MVPIKKAVEETVLCHANFKLARFINRVQVFRPMKIPLTLRTVFQQLTKVISITFWRVNLRVGFYD